MSNETSKTFLKGAVILAVAGVIIKFLGAIFRIPLANLVGDTGMGYYNSAYPIYVLLLTLSTAGIPTAISKLVSEKIAIGDNYEAHRIFKISFALLFAIGASTSLFLFFGAGIIVNVIGNQGAYLAMRAVAPALFFVPIMAALRGYFQGMQDMRPTAASQVAEQFFRVLTGLSLAFYLFPMGLKFAAAGASSGAAFGGIGGATVIGIIYLKRRSKIHKSFNENVEKSKEKSKTILNRILAIAIPVTIGASIMPIMNMIDLVIVMRRLQSAAGFSAEAANSLYGQLAGMVGAIINFPQVLSMSIAMSLVPVIAAAYQRKDMKFLQHNVELGVRASVLIGLPCAFGIMTLSEQIMLLLYPLQKASAISAAPCLFIMASGVVFLTSAQTLTGILQGLGKPAVPVINLAIGGLLKIVCTYVLTGIPSINVKGAAIGTVVAYSTAAILNFSAARKYTGTKFDVKLTFLKPLTASVIMSLCVFIAYRVINLGFSTSISTLGAVLAGLISYAVVLIAIKGITKNELIMFPKGEKLVKLLDKIQK